MEHTFDTLKTKVQSIDRLSPEDVDSFCAAAKPLKCKKGELLLKEGHVCTSIYFIETGYLRSYHTRDGLEINTGLHFEGSFVTNLKSLRAASPSESFIEAAEPAFLYEFTKEKVTVLYANRPPIVEFGKSYWSCWPSGRRNTSTCLPFILLRKGSVISAKTGRKCFKESRSHSSLPGSA